MKTQNKFKFKYNTQQIPYKGSKRSIAKPLFDFMNKENDKNTFVDLFFGGWSMSSQFLNNNFKVISNEYDEDVFCLLKSLLKPNKEEKEFWNNEFYKPMLIDKEKFKEVINSLTEKKYIKGYIKCVWSFGNNCKNYLFGKEIENYKLYFHKWLVNYNDLNDFIDLIQNISVILKIDLNYKQYLNIFEDFILVQKEKINIKRKVWLKLIKQLQQLEQLQRLQQLEQLEQLQQLQQLEQLERLQQLELYNMDYEECFNKIKNKVDKKKTIIYCDPPYKNTDVYNKKDIFNYERYYNFIKKVSIDGWTIYCSEYDMPDNFRCVFEIKKRVLLIKSQKENNKVERLFVYEEICDRL